MYQATGYNRGPEESINQAYSIPAGFFCKILIAWHTLYAYFFSILGEKRVYNIPEVTAAPHVVNWLSEDRVKLLNNCRDDKMLPDFAKRLICDGYMCFYQSPQVMMYQ